MKIIIFSLFVISPFLFVGCMAISMIGGGHSSHSNSSSTTLQKEVTSNGVKAEATFPPLVLNKETTFTLKVSDSKTGTAISNPSVWFHATFTHQPLKHHNGMMNDSIQTSRMDIQHGVNYDIELTDSTRSGILSVRYVPVQTGDYVITFHIVRGVGQPEGDILIEQKMVVMEEDHPSSDGMMGSFGTYAVITGAVMGSLMLYFLINGNSMF